MDQRTIYAGKPEAPRGSLCSLCVYGGVVRGHSENEQITICRRYWDPIAIRFAVKDCSEYADRRLPDVEDMKKVAWMLVTNKPGRTLGFVNAEQYREIEEADDDNDS